MPTASASEKLNNSVTSLSVFACPASILRHSANMTSTRPRLNDADMEKINEVIAAALNNDVSITSKIEIAVQNAVVKATMPLHEEIKILKDEIKLLSSSLNAKTEVIKDLEAKLVAGFNPCGSDIPV